MKTSYFLICFVFLFATKLTAQEKIFVREYTYEAGEMDSKLSCRAIVTSQIRTLLLNEVGVYVESENILKTADVGGKFYQDFVESIATISAGVTKLEILDETWNGKTFWMKASISVDKQYLEESLKQLIKGRQNVKELEETKQQLYAATNEIDKLRTEMSSKNKSGDLVNKEKSAEYSGKIDLLRAANYNLSGKEKYRQKDYKGAIADYTSAIELDPDFSSAYFNRAFSKDELKYYREAIADYTKAIEIDPDFIIAYFDRAFSKASLNDQIGAIVDFSKVIELDSTFAEAFFNRGNSKYNLRDYRGAIVDYSEAISINHSYAEAYFNRGVSKSNLFDHKGAVADYNKSIEYNSNYTDAYFNRGNSKRYLQDYAGAVADYTKVIELSPRSADAYYFRGSVKITLNKKDSGCLDLRKASEFGYEKAYEEIIKYCQ